MTQLTSSSASLRLGRAFHRLSSTKPLTSERYDYEPASRQRDATLSTRCNQPALQSHPNFAEESYAFVCFNILNILLTYKYIQHTRLPAPRNCNRQGRPSAPSRYCQWRIQFPLTSTRFQQGDRLFSHSGWCRLYSRVLHGRFRDHVPVMLRYGTTRTAIL